MINLKDYYKQRFSVQPLVQHEEKPQQPQVDSSHALESFAKLMGPTPAEREAKQRKQEEHNAKMQTWAGLFDGLRQLGNLYTTYKGATPQQLQTPYGQIEQIADRNRKRQAANDAYSREYALALSRLHHGFVDDARKAKVAEAQAKFFDTRSEAAKQKAELEKYKAARVVKDNGSLYKFDPVSGSLERLTETDPLYAEYIQAKIGRYNRMGQGGSGQRKFKDGSYVKETWTDDNGHKHEIRVDGRGNLTETVTDPSANKGNKGTKGKKNKGNSGAGSNKSGFFNK